MKARGGPKRKRSQQSPGNKCTTRSDTIKELASNAIKEPVVRIKVPELIPSKGKAPNTTQEGVDTTCTNCDQRIGLLIISCCGYAACIECIEKLELTKKCLQCKKVPSDDSWIGPQSALRIYKFLSLKGK
jgi:hypothetical protein